MNRYSTWTVGAAAVLTMLWADSVEARPERPGQVPNGFRRSCSTCHTGPSGGSRNAFGQDVDDTMTEPGFAGIAQWDLVFDIDSDGDGFTNGEELGDPEGTWVIGDPSPTFQSDPANPASTPPVCGDGAQAGDEECDGADLDGEDCQSLDFAGGELGCNDDCTFNIDACEDAEPEPSMEPEPEPEPEPDAEPEPEPEPEPDGGNGQDDDDNEGCTTAPGQTGGGPLGLALVLLGLTLLRRRG